MEAVLQLVVIICVFAFAMKKSKKNKKQAKSTTEKRYPAAKEQMAGGKINQDELKQRLVQKYASKPFEKKEVKKEAAVSSTILQRASANVSEDFEKEAIGKKRQAELFGIEEEEIVKEGNHLAEVDFHTIYDVPKPMKESELMGRVSDIMAKGMDTELLFQRDFVSEGLEMISRITI